MVQCSEHGYMVEGVGSYMKQSMNYSCLYEKAGLDIVANVNQFWLCYHLSKKEYKRVIKYCLANDCNNIIIVQ